MNDTAYKTLQMKLGADRVTRDEPLARFTTFKVGGPADYFYTARTKEELVDAVKAADEAGVPVFILGGGTNILIGDKGIRGLVIKNVSQSIVIRGMKGAIKKGEPDRTVYVEADAGVPINKLVRFTVEEGLAGLEMHLGLPGTVGGAVFMNSKWTHPTGYVGDVVHQATLLTVSHEIKSVSQDYFHFAYDYSSLQKTHDTVLSVTFALKQSESAALWKVANDSIAYRRESQPQGVLSAGCTFKNISKAQAMVVGTPDLTTSAGFLVDKAGLKGVREGGAHISEMHANFIVNDGKATAADVVKLIEKARSAVQHAFGVRLDEEIVRIGEF